MATRGKISKLTIQYVAGLFDGEGCVNIYQTKKYVDNRIGYELTIAIFNSHKEVIELLQENFGGCVQKRERGLGRNENWKIGYSWKLSCNQAKNLLEKLLPFLIIKKEQAKIAVEFQTLKESKNHRFIKNIKEINDFYEICYQKMRILNKKGLVNKTYYPQRLSEETLQKEAIVRTALKNAEIGRNDLSALQENARKGGMTILKKYGRQHYREMRSKVKKQQNDNSGGISVKHN